MGDVPVSSKPKQTVLFNSESWDADRQFCLLCEMYATVRYNLPVSLYNNCCNFSPIIKIFNSYKVYLRGRLLYIRVFIRWFEKESTTDLPLRLLRLCVR